MKINIQLVGNPQVLIFEVDKVETEAGWVSLIRAEENVARFELNQIAGWWRVDLIKPRSRMDAPRYKVRPCIASSRTDRAIHCSSCAGSVPAGI